MELWLLRHGAARSLSAASTPRTFLFRILAHDWHLIGDNRATLRSNPQHIQFKDSGRRHREGLQTLLRTAACRHRCIWRGLDWRPAKFCDLQTPVHGLFRSAGQPVSTRPHPRYSRNIHHIHSHCRRPRIQPTMPAIRGQNSKKKTRRHTRDLDQVHADLNDEKHLAEFKDAKPVEDLPGLGQYYCKECAKFFESEANWGAHQKGKVHKRR